MKFFENTSLMNFYNLGKIFLAFERVYKYSEENKRRKQNAVIKCERNILKKNSLKLKSVMSKILRRGRNLYQQLNGKDQERLRLYLNNCKLLSAQRDGSCASIGFPYCTCSQKKKVNQKALYSERYESNTNNDWADDLQSIESLCICSEDLSSKQEEDNNKVENEILSETDTKNSSGLIVYLIDEGNDKLCKVESDFTVIKLVCVSSEIIEKSTENLSEEYEKNKNETDIKNKTTQVENSTSAISKAEMCNKQFQQVNEIEVKDMSREFIKHICIEKSLTIKSTSQQCEKQEEEEENCQINNKLSEETSSQFKENISNQNFTTVLSLRKNSMKERGDFKQRFQTTNKVTEEILFEISEETSSQYSLPNIENVNFEKCCSSDEILHKGNDTALTFPADSISTISSFKIKDETIDNSEITDAVCEDTELATESISTASIFENKEESNMKEFGNTKKTLDEEVITQWANEPTSVGRNTLKNIEGGIHIDEEEENCKTNKSQHKNIVPQCSKKLILATPLGKKEETDINTTEKLPVLSVATMCSSESEYKINSVISSEESIESCSKGTQTTRQKTPTSKNSEDGSKIKKMCNKKIQIDLPSLSTENISSSKSTSSTSLLEVLSFERCRLVREKLILSETSTSGSSTSEIPDCKKCCLVREKISEGTVSSFSNESSKAISDGKPNKEKAEDEKESEELRKVNKKVSVEMLTEAPVESIKLITLCKNNNYNNNKTEESREDTVFKFITGVQGDVSVGSYSDPSSVYFEDIQTSCAFDEQPVKVDKNISCQETNTSKLVGRGKFYRNKEDPYKEKTINFISKIQEFATSLDLPGLGNGNITYKGTFYKKKKFCKYCQSSKYDIDTIEFMGKINRRNINNNSEKQHFFNTVQENNQNKVKRCRCCCIT